ncbi:MAG: DEAD/DEAH box helicase family protein [Candidatus Eremiobacteraeota bacterium]|nr:DEAD/DEAH box helicase family protein [Candidatus Eremiobacteraeota bacterium]
MSSNKKNSPVIHNKLVRDLIPKIVREQGKTPFNRKLEPEEFLKAAADKLLEEAYELYSECNLSNPKGILKESADILEVILALLNRHNFTLKDLLEERESRKQARGAFEERFFLESVNGKCPSYVIADHPLAVSTRVNPPLLLELIKSEIYKSDAVWIASAFFSSSVINMLLDTLNEFISSGGILRVLLSTMGNFNNPDHFIHLMEQVRGIGLKIFHPPGIPLTEDPPSFHLKTYLFQRRDGSGSIIIGSSNFTAGGFGKNIEWNYFSPGEVNLPFDGKTPFQYFRQEFEHLWEKESCEVTDEFLAAYRRRYERNRTLAIELFESEAPYGQVFTPNAAQKESLNELSIMRSEGTDKASIIAATGIGKTYLAAFDFKQSRMKKILFIAHRENILATSLRIFETIMQDSHFGTVYGGGKRNISDHRGVFAMVQTISRNLEDFDPCEFDYIVVDEFHHGMAATYLRVIDYFRPKFLLGLTATPERLDGRDVLELCDYNVAYEVRLLDAVEKGWLSSFQYYAIYDRTDYEKIAWRSTHYDEEELTKALSNDTRTSIVVNNLKKFLPSKGKIKALAFCSSIAHAKFTAHTMTNYHGIDAIALTGESSEEERSLAISNLKNEKHPLKVICSIDIFNEGIDIPEVSHVLFMRPTESFTIYLQQLGRGLRKHPGKEFLVVLDFIGNFRKAHIAPLALSGYTSVNDYLIELKSIRRKNALDIKVPDCCYISIDKEVQRIWDNEINDILSIMPQKERLKQLYQDIKDDLGKSPELKDFIASPHDPNPSVFIKEFENWLRAKLYCEGSLSEDEQSLLETPGERFLEHLESGLNEVKSYKMVVLKALLGIPGVQWKVEDIARSFLNFYLSNKDKLHDYDELARSTNPDNYSLNKVESHIKEKPLRYLSNKEEDWFIFDKGSNVFKLKEDIIPFWNDPFFRKLVDDRLDFLLHRYFYQRGKKMFITYSPEILLSGFPIDRDFAIVAFQESPIAPGDRRKITLVMNNNAYEAEIQRDKANRKYSLLYDKNSLLAEALRENLLKVRQSHNEKSLLLSIIGKHKFELRIL